MGVPLVGQFDSDTETLTITYKEEEGPGASQQQHEQQSASSGPIQQQGSNSGGGSTAHQQQQASRAQLGLNDEQFNLRLWLDHMQGKIINRQHIPRAQLPLQVGCVQWCYIARRYMAGLYPLQVALLHSHHGQTWSLSFTVHNQ